MPTVERIGPVTSPPDAFVVPRAVPTDFAAVFSGVTLVERHGKVLDAKHDMPLLNDRIVAGDASATLMAADAFELVFSRSRASIFWPILVTVFIRIGIFGQTYRSKPDNRLGIALGMHTFVS